MSIQKSQNISSLLKRFSLSLAVITLFCTELRAQETPIYLKNPNYKTQTGIYERSGVQNALVVMLGNSLTFNADWNEFLKRKDVANQGIVSDVTEGYIHRLRYVYNLKPAICFIEGGVNDVYENIPAEKIFENYKRVIDTLKAHSIIPVIQSTLLVSPRWHHAAEKNKEIEKLNTLLNEFSKNNSLEYLNLNSILSSGGFLRDELTPDGVHLNSTGYSLWAPEVEKILTKHGL